MRVNNTASYVAAEVRAEMARQELSQQALAKKLGWTQARLSRRISTATNGKKIVTFDVAELAEVARVLGVPVARFIPTVEAVSA